MSCSCINARYGTTIFTEVNKVACRLNRPNTRYTISGKINIAYQVMGEGPVDLVYIPGWASNIDLMRDCPPLAKFLLELSKVARVILFGKRGTVFRIGSQNYRLWKGGMEDILAVMDAVHSERAILFWSFGVQIG